jgi:hypothetical protein
MLWNREKRRHCHRLFVNVERREGSKINFPFFLHLLPHSSMCMFHILWHKQTHNMNMLCENCVILWFQPYPTLYPHPHILSFSSLTPSRVVESGAKNSTSAHTEQAFEIFKFPIHRILFVDLFNMSDYLKH